VINYNCKLQLQQQGSTASLETSFMHILFEVFMMATGTRLSLPGWTWITLLKGHFIEMAVFSFMRTTSPIKMFLVRWHILYQWGTGKYSNG